MPFLSSLSLSFPLSPSLLLSFSWFFFISRLPSTPRLPSWLSSPLHRKGRKRLLRENPSLRVCDAVATKPEKQKISKDIETRGTPKRTCRDRKKPDASGCCRPPSPVCRKRRKSGNALGDQNALKDPLSACQRCRCAKPSRGIRRTRSFHRRLCPPGQSFGPPTAGAVDR